ncbi:MAG: M48 family metalloprotease [Alphaproteobacteria bacterium]
MNGFDPAAATASYIAQLPSDLLTRSAAYTHGNEWNLLWDLLVNLVALILFLRTGLLVSLRQKIEAKRPRPNLAAFLVILVFLLIDNLIILPWQVYLSWWREHQFGFSKQSFVSWLSDFSIETIASSLFIAVAGTLIYLLVRRTRKPWWIWATGLTAIGLAVAFLIAPVFIEPLINDYKPAPPGPILDAVAPLARAAGIPDGKIFVYNGSKQSSRYTANVSGVFGSARIAMSDTMFAQGVDIAAVRGVVAHEIGHYVHRDPFALVGLYSLIAAIAFWLMDRLLIPIARVSGARKIDGTADHAALPIVVMLFMTVAFIATPLTNSTIRIFETRADAYSVELAHEPDGLARALIKTAEYRNPYPTRLEEIVFYDHPSVARRIRRLMDWKAAHLGEINPS